MGLRPDQREREREREESTAHRAGGEDAAGTPLHFPGLLMRQELPSLQLFPPFPEARGFPGGSAVKDLPAMWETRVQSLGWEDPLEKRMAIHASILAWRIP